MRKIYLIGVFLFSAITLSAQTLLPKVEDIAVSRSGSKIIVEYTLSMEGCHWCKTELYLSTDGGKTFYSSPLMEVNGDIGKVASPGRKTAYWNVTKESHLLTGEDLVFKVSVDSYKLVRVVKSAFLVMPTASVYPDLSYGGMIGWGKKVGFYVKFRSNFKSVTTELECNRNGKYSDGTDFWGTGKVKTSRMAATGGLLINLSKIFYLYGGGGYGSRILAWEEVSGSWAKVTDVSPTGISLDGGIILRFGKFALSAGVTSTDFKYLDAEIGIGFMF